MWSPQASSCSNSADEANSHGSPAKAWSVTWTGPSATVRVAGVDTNMVSATLRTESARMLAKPLPTIVKRTGRAGTVDRTARVTGRLVEGLGRRSRIGARARTATEAFI